MNKIAFIVITYCLFFIGNCYGQWVTQNSGTTQHLEDVSFINTQTGWVCGDNGTMLKTTNGGNNWFSLNTGINDRPFNSIFFINSNTGWSCTSLFGIAGLIIKTTNGGINWYIQYSSANKSFFALFFVDTLKGWASTSGTGGWVFRTTNGGITWDSVSLVTGTGRDIQFINSQTGWVTLSQYLYKTIDGGNNWLQQLDIIGNGEIAGMSFLNQNTGYLVSLELWRIYKTTNSGSNWSFLTALPDCFNAHSIFFTNVNTGYVSGDCGQMFSTSDGGLSWGTQATGTNSFLQSVIFVTDSIGWAVGGGGRIIYTNSAGQLTGLVNNNNNELPKEFSLEQNYPNPFNPITNIRFEVPLIKGGDRGLSVKLIIDDIVGKEVGVLLNEALKPGSYNIKWDASNFASGIYFYTLFAEGHLIDTKKLVLIK